MSSVLPEGFTMQVPVGEMSCRIELSRQDLPVSGSQANQRYREAPASSGIGTDRDNHSAYMRRKYEAAVPLGTWKKGQCSFQNVIRQHWKDLIWGFLMATWLGTFFPWDAENSASSKHSVHSSQAQLCRPRQQHKDEKRPPPLQKRKNNRPIPNLVKAVHTIHF